MSDFNLLEGKGPITPPSADVDDSVFTEYLAGARAIFAETKKTEGATPSNLPAELEALRWFTLPSEVENAAP